MVRTRFEIRMDPSSDECDVYLNGKRAKFDLDDVDEALAWIKRNGGEPGESVTVVEADGYRMRRKVR